jgi:hypothetical protein
VTHSWRDRILLQFAPQVARLTLVADPDGLLMEEGVLQGIYERGYELISFDDHIAFRFAYESKYRSQWDRGRSTDLVVVLRADTADLHSLPFDLLQAGRPLAFNLGELFPNLSYPVVAALERSDFDALYRAQRQYEPGTLGDNATKDFVLRHVFEMALELVTSEAELLRLLLRLHYRGQQLPATFRERLVQVLRRSGEFTDWPLETLVADRMAFLGFVQERWAGHLDELAREGGRAVAEQPAGYGWRYPGPDALPFDHPDVRALVDTLFLEGQLQPVSHPHAAALAQQWVAVGVRLNPEADRKRRLNELLDSLARSIPTIEARHIEWQVFGLRWAKLVALWHNGGRLDGETRSALESLQQQVDTAFEAWIKSRFNTLPNQPPRPPVMLHHVPRALAAEVGAAVDCKVALLVIDGLALDQWVTLREVLRQQLPGLLFDEQAVFAWVPTLTSISRQAIFAGRPPIYFPNSLYTTDKEPALWSQFWAEQELSPTAVRYVRALRDSPDLATVRELAEHPQVRVLGLVIDQVDRIMHGMQLGTPGMHNQVRQWAEGGFLAQLLTLLHEHEYGTVLTSDHGNIQATGCGRPAEGALAETRGERARVYTHAGLRTEVGRQFAQAIEWPQIGLPAEFFPLLAPGRMAFIAPGGQTVSHGSIGLEELLVPWVHFSWRPA